MAAAITHHNGCLPSSAQVDPASGISGGHVLNKDGDVYDVMLSLVDLSKNSDKYYLLQVGGGCESGTMAWWHPEPAWRAD